MKNNARLLSAIIIVVLGVLYAVVYYPSFTTGIEPADMAETLNNPNVCVTVYMNTGEVLQVPIEEYTASVVACEMPSNFDFEAMKAQAVAARTYGLAKEGKLCNTVHCQVYKTEDQLRKEKGESWMNTYWSRAKMAAYETVGEVLFYKGELAKQAVFHSSSGSRTENSEDVFNDTVPYLRSVSNPSEPGATHKNETKTYNLSYVTRVLNSAGKGTVTEEDVEKIKVTERTEGGNTKTVTVGSVRFTGPEIREYFELYSNEYKITVKNDSVTFTSNGYGHGVGMSQCGANGMAKAGYDYQQILKHYYKGTDIEIIEE